MWKTFRKPLSLNHFQGLLVSHMELLSKSMFITHPITSEGNHQHYGLTGSHGFTAQNQTFFVVKDSPHNGGSYRTAAAGDHTHTIYNEGSTEARVYNRGVQFMIKY